MHNNFNTLINEDAILDVINIYRNFYKVLDKILDDSSLYSDFCILAQIAPTDNESANENALANYLTETLDNFNADDPDNWWIDACRACLSSR